MKVNQPIQDLKYKGFLNYKIIIMKKLLILIFVFAALFSFGQSYTIEASDNLGFFKIGDVDYPTNHFGIRYDGDLSVEADRNFTLYNIHTDEKLIISRHYSAIVGVNSWDELSQLFKTLQIINGSSDVNIQDQHTPILIAKFNQITNSDTLTAATIVDQRYIVVDDTTGAANSDLVIVFSDITNRVYFGSKTSINIDTIFLDTPIDSEFPIGSDVDFSITNMAVDGSATSQIFGLRGSGLSSPIAVAFDITRIIFKCTTASAVDLAKFGDLAKLTNGLVLRKRDGTYQNLVNIKDNGELAGIMYDWTPYVATNPQQGIDGFVARLTFAGQSKIGVTVRLAAGEDLEFIIQDNISGITLFEVIAEGHIVE